MNLIPITLSVALATTASFMVMKNYQQQVAVVAQDISKNSFEEAIKKLPFPPNQDQCETLDASFAATWPADTIWTATVRATNCTTAHLSITLPYSSESQTSNTDNTEADEKQVSWPLSLVEPYSLHTPYQQRLQAAQGSDGSPQCEGYRCGGIGAVVDVTAPTASFTAAYDDIEQITGNLIALDTDMTNDTQSGVKWQL